MNEGYDSSDAAVYQQLIVYAKNYARENGGVVYRSRFVAEVLRNPDQIFDSYRNGERSIEEDIHGMISDVEFVTDFGDGEVLQLPLFYQNEDPLLEQALKTSKD